MWKLSSDCFYLLRESEDGVEGIRDLKRCLDRTVERERADWRAKFDPWVSIIWCWEGVRMQILGSHHRPTESETLE